MAKLGVPAIDPKQMFRGYKAFEEIAACKGVDAVQISTPPWFHVQHLDAVVTAGKHVYCEKPLGVDVAQTRQALEIGKRAQGKVSLDVGFQVRSAPPIAEVVRRIHEGALGKIASIAAHYNAPASTYPDRGNVSADELRLRNWLWDRVLSGDILVEQNIHVIDICNWILKSHPIKAVATGGRNVLTHMRRLLGQLPGHLHLSGRRAPELLLDAVRHRRLVQCIGERLWLQRSCGSSLFGPGADCRRECVGVEGR
jgi:myo-inositol 2-dehydrogenase/D-chiro-inositol 1-dehydrogenase